MKKIPLLTDDYHLPQSALDFAIKIALHEEATIFGILVQSLAHNGKVSYTFPADVNSTDQESSSLHA